MPDNKHLLDELTKLYVDDKTSKVAGISSKFRIPFQEAEDIYQKAFIKAFKNLDKFKGESSLKTWMFRIVQNTFFDHARKSSTRLEKNFTSIVPADIDSDDFLSRVKDENNPDPANALEKADTDINIGGDIVESLGKLSAQHQKVIDLVFKKGYSYEEAAKTSKCSIGTIMSRVFYARKNFINYYANVSKVEKKRVPLVIYPS